MDKDMIDTLAKSFPHLNFGDEQPQQGQHHNLNQGPPNRQLTDIEAKGFIDQVKLGNKFRFKSANTNSNTNNNPQNYIQNARDKLNNNQVIKLSEYKDKLKNQYLNKLLDETFTDMPKLEEPIPYFQKGWEKRTIYPRLRKHVNNMIRINEFLDMYPTNFVRMTVIKKDLPALRKARFKEKEQLNMKLKQKEREQKNNHYRNHILKGINHNSGNNNEASFPKFKSKLSKDEFADLSFKILTDNINNQKHNVNTNENNNENKVNQSRHRMGSNDIIDVPSSAQDEIKNHKFGNNKEDVLNQLRQNPATKKIIDEASDKDSSNIVYVPEIHSVYKRDRPVQKTLTIENPTKTLILNTLLKKNEFNDLMTQQENPMVFDPLGLYTVLKNIQTRQCSIGYLCIEIGTIYGDFNLLNMKKIKVDSSEKENVHLVIQPIVIQKHTKTIEHPPHVSEPPKPEKEKVKLKIDDLDDCDFFNSHMDSLRFKVT